MKIKFTQAIDFGKFIVYYTTIPYNYLAKVVNKTKTHLKETDVYLFENFKEMEEYFKKEIEKGGLGCFM